MQHIRHDLGYVSGGSIVEVRLSAAANVRLLDASNYSSYRSGRPHGGRGGLARETPVRLQIPHTGTWYVAVDMQGLRGSVRSSARVIPAQALRPLPEINQAPLRSVPSLVHEVDDEPLSTDSGDAGKSAYDVFISHASEDKEEIVRPLAVALQAAGLAVWYDEFELRIGDSLRRKIDKGIARSRFGVVVLSQAFFGKGWPEYELDGLVTRSVSGEQNLLPIWHKVTKSEVIGYSPSLADRLARNTAMHTVQEIAAEIADVIRNPPN